MTNKRFLNPFSYKISAKVLTDTIFLSLTAQPHDLGCMYTNTDKCIREKAVMNEMDLT